MKNDIGNLLEKHFDTAFAAPDGIKKLRELILTLAMQGKLVPQDPNDPPAGELLKEIEAEKQQLLKEGKIKKPKLLPKIKPEEVPYKLPEGWEIIRFYDLATEIATGPFGSMIHKSDYVMGGTPLVNPSHMIDGKIVQDSAVSVSLDMARKLDAYRLHENDIVMARRGEMGRCAIVTAESAGCLCGTGSFILRFIQSISRRYIMNLFKTKNVRAYLTGNSIGTTMTNLNHGILNKMPVSLPPLPEQHRIVAKIDLLMARCDKLEKLRAEREQIQLSVHTATIQQLLNTEEEDGHTHAWRFLAHHFGDLYTVKQNVSELRKAILQLAVMGKLVPQDPNDPPVSELFERIDAEKQKLFNLPAGKQGNGKIIKTKPLAAIKSEDAPYELPREWVWTHFDDVVDISSGVTKGRKLSGKNVISVPYLRVADVQRGFLDLAETKEIEIADNEIDKYRLRLGDLLITEGGDWDKVGRTCIWREEISLCVHQNHIFRARKILSEQNETWLEKYLNSPVARTYFAGAAKQTTNLASINKTQLRGCPVPLPSLPEQHRIVAKIEQLMALCDTLEQHIDGATSKQTELLGAVMAKV